MSNLKKTATTDTTKREEALTRVLNGEATEEDKKCFSCSSLHLDELRKQMPGGYRAKTEGGGLGKHYDGTMENDEEHTKMCNELKHSVGKKTPRSELEWRPWLDGVEFAQGQTKSQAAIAFLGDCGRLLMRSWFTEHVQPFVKEHIPEFTELEEENYYNCASGMSIPKKEENTLGAKFIEHLRKNKKDQENLRKRFVSFEESYLETHLLDHKALEVYIKERIEQKDNWICINKAGAHWIEGFNVKGLTYVGTVAKPKGGKMFSYTLSLQKKSGGEVKNVPILLKFHWKNGGQAVQNLNFLLI